MPERLTLAHAFDESWRAWRRRLRKCRAHATPRAVHQLRVESRRLAALLDVLGRVAFGHHKRHRKACDRLAAVVDTVLHHLSALRDAQVQEQRVRTAAARQAGLEELADHLGRRETHRKRRVRRALRELGLGRARKTAARLHRELKRAPEPSPTALSRAVNTKFSAVRRRVARLAPEDPDSIHRLRIAIKQFRYTAETAASLSQLRLRHRPAVRALQDQMGEAHDAELLIDRVRKFSPPPETSDPATEGDSGRNAAAAASPALIRRLERERDRRVARVVVALRDVDRWWPPARPAAAQAAPDRDRRARR
jgi:CHAD domain-containing protein